MGKRYCIYCMAPLPEDGSCPVCGKKQEIDSATADEHHLLPGTILAGRYMTGRVLGGGGFGITYLGLDLRLELKVAIKEFFPIDHAFRFSGVSPEVSCYTGKASESFTEGKRKFLREALTMARMEKQTCVVGVKDFFEENNTAYIVMEYIDGTTLHQLVDERGFIPIGELLPMLEPLFDVLGAMHEEGLIHRDISPDNLMLENGKIRLLDFGCAREAVTGTETMTISLKSGFAPIEQYQQKGQGAWTDVYALAATIYYCLTGEIPVQSIDRLCVDELASPNRPGNTLTPRQEQAILYGMGIRPRRRFQTMKDLYRALYIPEQEERNGEEKSSS